MNHSYLEMSYQQATINAAGNVGIGTDDQMEMENYE